MSNLFENFDGSLSLPATLTSAGSGTVAVVANGTAITSPNVMSMSTTGTQAAEVDSVDSFAGDAVFSFWFKMTSLSTPLNLTLYVTFRRDAGAGNNYVLFGSFGSGDLTPELTLVEVVSHSPTTLATVGSGYPFAEDEWYHVTISPAGTLVPVAIQRQSDSKWMTSSNTWQSSPTNCISVTGTNSAGGTIQYYLDAGGAAIVNTMLVDNLSVAVAGGGIPVPTGATIATTGVTGTFQFDSGGASVSSTDYTKVILGGQATACSAITALTVSTGTTSSETGTLTFSGLIVPTISITTNFTSGALTNANGVNVATGVLTGTNNSTTIDLIIDSGTLSGSTATINFAPVNVGSLVDHYDLYVNNSSVGNFTTGGTAAPVTGGDLITIGGYLANDTLIASGTLFTVTSVTVTTPTTIQAVLSGSLTMTPPTNAFANNTWRDTTQGVNSTAFVSQSGAAGTWSVASFGGGDSWAFTAIPTYVMNMTGTITGSSFPASGTIAKATAGLLLDMV